MNETLSNSEETSRNESMQSFLSSAITDISTYIQLTDTKVSIIMAAVVAMMVAIFSDFTTLENKIALISPCSWRGVLLLLFVGGHILSLLGIFVFGILTIRGHTSKINYTSKWFLSRSTSEYSFDAYKTDVLSMNTNDIIENMAAELYKLNDINRQKVATNKWVIRFFAGYLVTLGFSFFLLFL